MSSKRFQTVICALFCCLFGAEAQNFDAQVNLTIDRNDGIYAKGDTVRVYADMAPELSGPLIVTVEREGIDIFKDTIQSVTGKKIIYEHRFDEAAAGMVFVNSTEHEHTAAVGFIVSPEDFRPGFERPKDLKKFWKNQVKAMRAIPMDVQLTEVSPGEEYEGKARSWQFIINGPDETPCRGYIAIPVDAARHSLPIYMFAHAAGVSGGWCRAQASHAAEMATTSGGSIAIDINAHGLPDDMPKEYYVELENGRLKDYSDRIITDHESYYFRTMFLRMVRALDYMSSRPEWDGKRVLVQGESQGGAQTAAIAGIDKRVGAIVLQVPAMFDTGGDLAGRLSGWPKPLLRSGQNKEAAMSIAPYYDCAQLVNKSKALKFVEIGLIDNSCPAPGIYAGINGCKGHAQVLTFPYRTHTYVKSPHEKEWEDEVLSKRIEFINNYLK